MRKIVYQLKVTLNGSEPPVWRQIQLTGDQTLEDVHDILQSALGWQNQEMFQFIIDDQFYGDADLGTSAARQAASSVTLGDLIKRPKCSFIYEYDLADGWEHDVTIEKIRPVDSEEAFIPVCLDGANATPPENSGGIFGYYELLSVLKDPQHPAYQEMKELYGDVSPRDFDLEATNARLRSLFVINETADAAVPN